MRCSQRTSLIHGDILISITAELGKIGWIPPNFGEAFINQHTGLVRLKKDQSDSLFIAYLLSTAKLNKQINRLNDSGAKSGLNLPTIASINIHLPKISEQNKIADFLVTIDKKIAQLTQKCELLARYKKGVMQQIFSQELRFKDDGDRDFPDWEERELGGLSKSIMSGKTKPSNGKYFIYGSTGIIGKCSNYTHDGNFLLIARVGANAGMINKVSGKFSVTDNTLIFDAKDDIIVDFIYFNLLNYDLNKLVFGSGQPLITGGQLKVLKINLPLKSEQIKIANFLTSIDEKITEAQTYLDTVKQYKQGLLQQMFV